MADGDSAFAESVRYVARTFLQDAHLSKLSKTMASRWEKMHSLSAALRLMQSHGVVLTEQEEEELSRMDEVAQIGALVNKIPVQTNDEFQHFFIQLQLLVSTASRLREALECGDIESVEDALEGAEAAGILEYILRVAVVQAGNQAQALRDSVAEWSKAVDNKMGKLVRGQSDCIAAQKKLAALQEQFAIQSGEVNARGSRMIMRFFDASSKHMATMCFHEWVRVHKRDMFIQSLEVEFQARIEDADAEFAKWQQSQIQNCKGTMLRQIKEQNDSLLADVFWTWKSESEARKFDREHAGKIADMQAKLAASNASYLENAKSTLMRMQMSSAGKLTELAFQGWSGVLQELRAEKEAELAKQQVSAKLADFTKRRSESAQGIMNAFNGSTDSGLLSMCLREWVSVKEQAKKEAELAAILQEKNSSLTAFADRNKRSGVAAMESAASCLEVLAMLQPFVAWAKHAKVEKKIRACQVMVDAKRQQLFGVQQMFRGFAVQLEAGMSPESKASAQQPARHGPGSPGLSDHKESRSRHRSSKQAGHSGKMQQSVSLPALNPHPNSRPNSRAGVSHPRQAWA